MGKTILSYTCNQCGHQSVKWLGKCPGCGSWNSLIEEAPLKAGTSRESAVPVSMDAITSEETLRISTGIGELDRVLGKGVVPGAVVLIGGDPGIGKSTLLLQVANCVGRGLKRVLYLSGEESIKQIRLRSERLGINNSSIFLVGEQNVDCLAGYMDEINPCLVIVDSIQAVYTEAISSVPGSISQLRECTAKIVELAKKRDIPFFLVGHVTKDGALAGPKVLEHMVDVVVYFSGEMNHSYRLLRSVKNRFGSTEEIALLEMTGQGLLEVKDPSGLFLSSDGEKASGTAIAVSLEGSRPILFEVQALAAPAGHGYPRRMASGIDQNRLALIIAVLEKRLGYNFSNYDVFVKVTGGLFVRDPSTDLAIAAAVASSYLDRPLPADAVFIGELSLSGQIRPVPALPARLKEIRKMGFNTVFLAEFQPRGTPQEENLNIIGVNNLSHWIQLLWRNV